MGTLCAFDIAQELQRLGYATVASPFSAADVAAPEPKPAGNGGSGGGSNSSSGDGNSSSGGGSDGGSGGARGRPVSVTCYTYGAPRTGNHAFANELVEKVPDTWAVINDQDLGEHAAECWQGRLVKPAD